MKTTILSIFLLITGCHVYAQESSEVMRVNNGTDISKSMNFQQRFYYDKFQDGKVFFRNGRVVKARLNYSLAHGEVQFIDTKKDTLILTEKEFINHIAIGVDTFYFYQKYGHVKKIGTFNNVTLVEKPHIMVLDNERPAAYGQYSSTSAISTYSSFTNSSGLQQALQGGDKVILKKETDYLLIDKNRNILPLNKGSIVKFFPKQKRALNDYFKYNKVALDTEEEVVKILNYASSL